MRSLLTLTNRHTWVWHFFQPVLLRQVPGTRWIRIRGADRTSWSGSDTRWRRAGLMPVCWTWPSATWTGLCSAGCPETLSWVCSGQCSEINSITVWRTWEPDMVSQRIILTSVNVLRFFVLNISIQSAALDLHENAVLSESEFDLLDNLLFPFMSVPGLGPLLETVVVQPTGKNHTYRPPLKRASQIMFNMIWCVFTDRSEAEYSYLSEYRNQLTPESDHGYDSLSESLQSSHNGTWHLFLPPTPNHSFHKSWGLKFLFVVLAGSLMNPSSPECSGSDSDPEYSVPSKFLWFSSRPRKPSRK